MCYNYFMSRNFKRCPRCNAKIPTDFGRCGNCGLNYIKLESATNAEAKSAFRMGEKERILYTNKIPSDVKKSSILVKCMLGGWFGLHYFNVGKLWRGIIQLLGAIFAIVYTYFAVEMNIRTGYLGNLILVCGIIWAYSFVAWVADCLAIIFNRFKYPVSLPYSEDKVKKENLGLQSANKGE